MICRECPLEIINLKISLSLPTDYNTGGIVGALVDWFESFDCPVEMAWEEEECPVRPRIVPTEDDTCVGAYQETAPANCAEGFKRNTLMVRIEWGTKSFQLYWNEERVPNYKMRWKILIR